MGECNLSQLPNELLLHILALVPTPKLLSLTLLSHRIYALILRILHERLVAASELESHSVLLEWFHPSAKLTEPPYFCTYHGTHGLELYDGFAEDDKNLARRLGDLRSMYSRFRPFRRELETGGRKVRRPPGDVPGSRTYAGAAQERFEGETVKQVLSLDGYELFTQLVAQTHLMMIGRRNGRFSPLVSVEDGVVRVWRQWLRKIAARQGMVTSVMQQEVVEEVGKGKEAVREISEGKDVDEERILWATPAKNTGVRFNVKERRLRRDAPILVRADEEDIPVSYEIEYEELLIRTSHLLLMLEEALVQEDNTSGKAIVFGSFG